MKNIVIALVFIIITGEVFAQKTIKISELNNQEIQTVFKRNKRDGFYGGLSTGYSPINGTHGVVFSAKGCWIMDHWFAFGISGTSFVSNMEQLDYFNFNTSNNEMFLGGGYGGVIFEPMLASLKTIHVTFPILVGGGAVAQLTDTNFDYYPISDYFFVVEPGIELELNLTQWLRASVFATYRYTSDISIEQVASDALRSYSTGVSLKVGLF